MNKLALRLLWPSSSNWQQVQIFGHFSQATGRVSSPFGSSNSTKRKIVATHKLVPLSLLHLQAIKRFTVTGWLAGWQAVVEVEVAVVVAIIVVVVFVDVEFVVVVVGRVLFRSGCCAPACLCGALAAALATRARAAEHRPRERVFAALEWRRRGRGEFAPSSPPPPLHKTMALQRVSC